MEHFGRLRPLVRAARFPTPIGVSTANPIDAFVLAKLEDKGLSPSPPRRPAHADPPADIRPARPAADARRGRRVRVDDPAPDAYERLVDRLLASPALRRALGAALDGRRPLRRDPRPRPGRRPRERLALSRLPDPRRSTPTSLTRVSSRSRSPATCCSRTTRPPIAGARVPRRRAVGRELAEGHPRRHASTRSAAQYLDRDDMITTVIHGLRQHDRSTVPAATTTSSTRFRRTSTTASRRFSRASSGRTESSIPIHPSRRHAAIC